MERIIRIIFQSELKERSVFFSIRYYFNQIGKDCKRIIGMFFWGLVVVGWGDGVGRWRADIKGTEIGSLFLFLGLGWGGEGLLVGVLLDFVVEEFELDAGLAEEFFAFGASVVFAFADDALDAAVDDEHGACAAGCHAAVEGGAVEGYAASGGLADGVLLGMDGADAVGGDMSVGVDGLSEEVSDFVAVRESGGRADVAGDEELAVFDDDAAAAAAVAGGALAGCVGEFHEVFVPGGATVGDFLQHGFDLSVEVVDGAAVVEAVVGVLDAVAEVLLVGVVVVHLALFVGDEGVVVYVVGLGAAEDGALVADAWVGVDGEEVEVGFAAQGVDFARCAHALDDAVASGCGGLLVELLDDPGGGVLGAQVVAYEGHGVAVHVEAASFYFFDEEGADAVVYEAAVFDQIVDDGAFACSQRPCDSDGNHS